MPAIFFSFFGWIVFGFSFSQTSIRIPYGWFGRIMLKLFNILGRYAPEMNPRYMNFTVEGVKLADQKFDCDDTRCSVKLDQLRPQTSGVYKCEVSSDAPHFNLISGTANMSVAGKFVWIVVYVIQKLWLFELVFFSSHFEHIEPHLFIPFQSILIRMIYLFVEKTYHFHLITFFFSI